VTETARVLLTAAILSAITVSTFAWKISRIDPEEPARLIGELRLAQWGAVLLAAVGAIPLGMSLGSGVPLAGTIDAAVGVVFVGLAGLSLQRDPREGLLLVSGVFVLHALVDISHRPGWLATDLVPPWYTVGCAVYDVYLAAVCFWARRR
jgi:hypothetical protein